MKRFLSSLIVTLILGSIILISLNYFKKDNEENELGYIFDMSYATTIEATNLQELIKNEEIILMIGNKNQNSTAKMSAFLKDVASDYNLKIYYLEKDGIDLDIYNTWANSIPNLNEFSGFSPVLLVFKNNALINGYPGDAEYRNLLSFLKYCEVKGVV